MHNAVHIVEAEALGHDQSLLQADFPVQQEKEDGNHRHKAQAANLNQTQQYNLAEACPLGIGVHQHQARHAGGGRGSEPRCQKSAAFPAAGGDGQHQQQRTQQNHGKKGQDNILLCPNFIRFLPATHEKMQYFFPQNTTSKHLFQAYRHPSSCAYAFITYAHSRNKSIKFRREWEKFVDWLEKTAAAPDSRCGGLGPAHSLS